MWEEIASSPTLPVVDLCNYDIDYCPAIFIVKKIFEKKTNHNNCDCLAVIKDNVNLLRRYDVGVVLAISCLKENCDILRNYLNYLNSADTTTGVTYILKHISNNNMSSEIISRAREAIAKYTGMGFRLVKLIPDLDLLHLVFDAGCGRFTVTCSPVECLVSETEGVKVDNDIVKCTKTPPYLVGVYWEF